MKGEAYPPILHHEPRDYKGGSQGHPLHMGVRGPCQHNFLRMGNQPPRGLNPLRWRRTRWTAPRAVGGLGAQPPRRSDRLPRGTAAGPLQSPRRPGPVPRAGCWVGGLGGRAARPPLGCEASDSGWNRRGAGFARTRMPRIREYAGCIERRPRTRPPFSSCPACSGPHGCGLHCWRANRPARARPPGALHCEPGPREGKPIRTRSDSGPSPAIPNDTPPAGIRGRSATAKECATDRGVCRD